MLILYYTETKMWILTIFMSYNPTHLPSIPFSCHLLKCYMIHNTMHVYIYISSHHHVNSCMERIRHTLNYEVIICHIYKCVWILVLTNKPTILSIKAHVPPHGHPSCQVFTMFLIFIPFQRHNIASKFFFISLHYPIG